MSIGVSKISIGVPSGTPKVYKVTPMRSLSIPSLMTFEILCGTGPLLEKSCLLALDEWNDHHQTIQHLLSTNLFDATLGSVGSIWKATGVSWATAQLTPTPSSGVGTIFFAGG